MACRFINTLNKKKQTKHEKQIYIQSSNPGAPPNKTKQTKMRNSVPTKATVCDSEICIRAMSIWQAGLLKRSSVDLLNGFIAQFRKYLHGVIRIPRHVSLSIYFLRHSI